MENIESYLIEQAEICKIKIAPPLAEAFQIYLEQLLEWNEKINLTAVTDPKEAVMKHFIDSLYLTKFVDFSGKNLIDVGSGAGFPGIPLKLFEPSLSVTLLDSLQKRLRVLDNICQRLQIETKQIHGRAEECGQNLELRGKFDLVSARAVAQLPLLCEYCLPFLKRGGLFCAMKGPQPQKEIESAQHALKELGAEVEAVKKYSLPDGEGRSLILIRQKQFMPKKYPRPGGKIKKQHL